MEKKAKLCYDDREQHEFYGKNDNEIMTEAKRILDTIKQEMGNNQFNRLYPEQKWEIKIYG